MGMNPLPPESKPAENQRFDNTGEEEAPRGQIRASPKMATTLSWPAALLPSLPTTHEMGRNLHLQQLPPLPTANKSVMIRESILAGPGSPTSSLGSTTSISYSHKHQSLFDSQTPQAGREEASSREHYSAHTTDEGLGRQRNTTHGLKRSHDQCSRPRRSPKRTDAILPLPLCNPGSTPHKSYPMPSAPSSATMPRQASAPSASYMAAPQGIVDKDRFKLFLRQQPRAARAGPDGKDRRTIDPPPVLQLLINDFDLDKDGHYLKAQEWVVHAKLIAAEKPHEDMTTVATQPSERGKNQSKVIRLLLGTNVSSPFYCSEDPNPETAPQHPTSRPVRAASPSDRLLPKHVGKDPEAYKTYPAAFFIFADLSVRKAGQYRLEFRLMKMEPSICVPGTVVPTISTAVTDVFNVVNAKDFDQVQPSTALVRGLLDSGAGFPLKLKKGLRESQRPKKRGQRDDDDEDDDVDEDDEDDNDNAAYDDEDNE